MIASCVVAVGGGDSKLAHQSESFSSRSMGDWRHSLPGMLAFWVWDSGPQAFWGSEIKKSCGVVSGCRDGGLEQHGALRKGSDFGLDGCNQGLFPGISPAYTRKVPWSKTVALQPTAPGAPCSSRC